jgi:hypothetical protein
VSSWLLRPHPLPFPFHQLYEPIDSLQGAVAKFAEDALMAGQGNSGTVLSHFFITLSGELAKLGGAAKVTVPQFAACLQKCGENIHSSFPPDKVKEGTIVSVVRKSTLLADGKFTTLKELLEVWEAQAKVALYETPDELEVDGVYVLKEARAKDPSIDSDSGAKGFYYFVQGVGIAIKSAVSSSSSSRCSASLFFFFFFFFFVHPLPFLDLSAVLRAGIAAFATDFARRAGGPRCGPDGHRREQLCPRV